MPIDETNTFTVKLVKPTWLDALKEWWNSLPWWQKGLIITGAISGSTVGVYYALRKAKT